MNPRYEIYELIDRYLDNKMNVQERLDFENQLRVDNDLMRIFEAQKIAHRIIVDKELLILKKQISKDLGIEDTSKNIKPRYSKYIISGVIVASTIIAIYLFWGKDKSDKKVEKTNKTTPFVTDSVKHTKERIIDSITTTNNNLNLKEVNSNKKTLAKVSKEDTCGDSLISFSCQARGTCEDKNDGAIEIDINTIKLEAAPFMFSIMPNSNFKSEPVISNLNHGKYNLYIKDAKQCIHKLNTRVEVPKLNCNNLLK